MILKYPKGLVAFLRKSLSKEPAGWVVLFREWRLIASILPESTGNATERIPSPYWCNGKLVIPNFDIFPAV